jgi:hypothetical protein
MKITIRYFWILLFSAVCCCSVMMDDNPTASNPGNHPSTVDHPSTPRVTKKIAGFFPFEDNSNIWNYTESGGNTVMILVTDTISDDGSIYYRVSFRENRVDTTDDWFLRSSDGVYFGQSLAGDYDLFLPATVDSASGAFMSAGSNVTYCYYDSLLVNGSMFYAVLRLRYNYPIIHGFNEIVLADSIGIVELIDRHGRWPISYEIDSCLVGGIAKKF